MATYLVTGGAGFIGSHLVDSLQADGHRVLVLDDFSTGKLLNLDPRVTPVIGDIRDRGKLDSLLSEADGCFHLAAIASVARANEDWPGTHGVNLSGTIAILDACRARRLPVVYASSAAVYGDAAVGSAVEDLRCRPLTAYGADKFGCELHASVGWGVHGVPSFGLRFFNVYGPRQDPASPYSGVISIFAAAIAGGRPITVHGDGLQSRDFVYVADVVDHLRAAMGILAVSPGAHVSNVCTGLETTVVGLAHALAKASRMEATILHGPARPGDIRRSVGSPALARSILGITAGTPLVVGLTRTLAV